jgi:hypothetical protein
VAGLVGIGIGAFALLPGQPEPPRIPVLVELFTSEGCSSCPPADELLIRLDKEQFVPGALVIPLSEHVAYWNGSWHDPFSDSAFTERQRAYHPTTGSTALYTPEMVVDGRMQFVGSQRMLAEHSIASAITTPKAVVDITVTGEADQGPLQVDVAISETTTLGATEALEVWLAVTETALETEVQRGENARRRLRHTAVVRSLEHIETLTRPLPDRHATSATVPVASEWQRSNLRVVVFLQEPQTRHIHGVGQVSLD